MSYLGSTSQLAFLQLLSDRARQTIIYQCKNSAAWYNSETKGLSTSIKILSHNGVELHAGSSNKLKPNLLHDDCHVSIRHSCGWGGAEGGGGGGGGGEGRGGEGREAETGAVRGDVEGCGAPI